MTKLCTNMTKMITQVRDNKKQEYLGKLTEIDRIAVDIENQQWTLLKNFLFDSVSFPGITYATGVYMIVYSTDCRKTTLIYYIGQGNISRRKTVHKGVFLNEGAPLLFKNDPTDPNRVTSTTDSVIARKMYKKDPNMAHWYFTYISCPKDWANHLEESMIAFIKPEGNDVKMSGKS